MQVTKKDLVILSVFTDELFLDRKDLELYFIENNLPNPFSKKTDLGASHDVKKLRNHFDFELRDLIKRLQNEVY